MCWDVKVFSIHDGVFLLVNFGLWLLHIDNYGKVVASFHQGSGAHDVSISPLKESLVPHTFFTALEGHAVKDSPFM